MTWCLLLGMRAQLHALKLRNLQLRFRDVMPGEATAKLRQAWKEEIEARQNRGSTRAKTNLVATAPAPAPAATAAVFTTTATTATTAVFTTTTAAAAAGGALFARLGHVNREGATANFLAVQSGNGLLRFFGGAHGDEPKSARTTGFPVHQQIGFSNRAMRAKRVLQVVFGGVEGKISYKQFITHVMLYCPTNRHFLQTVPERRV